MLDRGCRDDPTCHHLYESDRLSQRARSLIGVRAHDVWQLLQRPGGGELNCGPATDDWRREFLHAGIPAASVAGGGIGLGRKEGGYRLADGSFSEHFWLAVDQNLALFDPTWAQFADEGAPSLDRYMVMTNQSFVEWREAELAAGWPRDGEGSERTSPANWRDRVLRRR